jgi:hypothetical protein
MSESDLNILKLPEGFIRDCLECGCQIGTYGNGYLAATDEQLDELRDRAEHYAGDDAPDVIPRGLRASARNLLKALKTVDA